MVADAASEEAAYDAEQQWSAMYHPDAPGASLAVMQAKVGAVVGSQLQEAQETAEQDVWQEGGQVGVRQDELILGDQTIRSPPNGAPPNGVSCAAATPTRDLHLGWP